MLKYRFVNIALIGLMGLIVATCPAPISAGQSAVIQATAVVVPSLGLTEASEGVELSAVDLNQLAPGSHLFWLYYPKPNGVSITVTPAAGGSESEDISSELSYLATHQYAALVELDSNLIASRATSEPVLVTIIYTDN